MKWEKKRLKATRFSTALAVMLGEQFRALIANLQIKVGSDVMDCWMHFPSTLQRPGAQKIRFAVSQACFKGEVYSYKYIISKASRVIPFCRIQLGRSYRAVPLRLQPREARSAPAFSESLLMKARRHIHRAGHAY